MQELSMHILDIVQNSLAAGATRVDIRIREALAKDLLMIEVRDNGRGISQEVLSRVMDPFFTSRTTREVGLGLSLFKEATERTGGYLEVHSEEGKGTWVIARFRLDYFDRAPLGDMGEPWAFSSPATRRWTSFMNIGWMVKFTSWRPGRCERFSGQSAWMTRRY